MLSEEEREIIYLEEKRVYSDSLRWFSAKGFLRIEAPVVRPNGEELTLHATWRGRYSFILIARNNQKIRQWDFKAYPSKPPHKHKWTPHGEILYPVDDIPMDNADRALHAFLKECNINIEGEFQQNVFNYEQNEG